MNCRAMGEGGEEGSSEGRKHETTSRGTNIALRICALCLLWGFPHCLQAVQDVQEKSGDQKWLDKSLFSLLHH